MLIDIMDFAFWPIMLLGPAVMLTLVRTPPDVEVNRAEVKRLTAWVWFWTLLSVAAFVLLRVFWPDFPRPMMLGAIAPAFSLSLRAVPLKNPDWGGQNPQAKTRTASLVSRKPTQPVTRGWWMFAGVLVGGMLIAVALRPLQAMQELPDRNEFVLWLSGLGMTLFAAMSVLLAAWAVARTREEPEPLNADSKDDAPKLAASYASLRNFRAWCFYWMFAVTMPVVMGGFGVVMAWVPLTANIDRSLGMAGGILGGLIGVAGAVFGTVASLRRVRINRELRETQEKENAGAAV